MVHINDRYGYSPAGRNDSLARAREIDNWNLIHTAHQAASDGLDITVHHLSVMTFMRSFYVEHGWPKTSHHLTQVLDKKFAAMGGNKYLHRLFPSGPIAQGTRLAGLPTPACAVDKSFGTTF